MGFCGSSDGGMRRDSLRGLSDDVIIHTKGKDVMIAPRARRAPMMIVRDRDLRAIVIDPPDAEMDDGHDEDEREEHDRGGRSEPELVEAEALEVDVERG